MELPPSAGGLAALAPSDLPPAVLAAVAARAGNPRQPLSGYLYQAATAVTRARQLRAALPAWAEVFFAVKANSYPPLVAALSDEVDGFEVASGAEAALVSGARLIAAGPGKSAPMLSALVEHGVEIINAESELELHRINAAALTAGRRVPVALRINPDRIAVTGSLLMGGTASQFGLPEAAARGAIAVARGLPGIELVGFHVHAVCNNLDADAHADYVRWCLDWSVRTAAEHGIDLRVVDVGGGLGVPFAGEQPFDLGRFGARLAELRPPDSVRILFEPGRFIVTECGFYAAEITDVKHSRGTTYVILRGGINHFQIPTSWNILHRFAVVPVEAWPGGLPRPSASHTPVTVVGELCTPEDTLAVDMTVRRVRAGDVLVFPLAGSYGYEFAMPEFLGHPRATRCLL